VEGCRPLEGGEEEKVFSFSKGKRNPTEGPSLSIFIGEAFLGEGEPKSTLSKGGGSSLLGACEYFRKLLLQKRGSQEHGRKEGGGHSLEGEGKSLKREIGPRKGGKSSFRGSCFLYFREEGTARERGCHCPRIKKKRGGAAILLSGRPRREKISLVS